MNWVWGLSPKEVAERAQEEALAKQREDAEKQKQEKEKEEGK